MGDRLAGKLGFLTTVDVKGRFRHTVFYSYCNLQNAPQPLEPGDFTG